MSDERERQKDLFLKWIGEHYEEQQLKIKKFCSNKHLEWSEDIFQDTIVKICEKILRHGINDPTENGFENYFFISYRFNLSRESEYARNKKRDKNINDDNITSYWEEYLQGQLTTDEKLKNDLLKDFLAYRVLEEIALHSESPIISKCVALKTLDGYTYKQLRQRFPDERNLMQRVKDEMDWAKRNINKEALLSEFQETFFD